MVTSRTAGLIASLLLVACNTAPKEKAAQPDPASASASASSPVAPSASPSTEGALRLGAPIETSVQKIALGEIAKNPNEFVGKTFATTGTVTAVCQHMGCWMEIKDDAGEAHIKMAGHAFFVPKTASGRKARVLATLEKAEANASCEGEGHEGSEKGKGKGCRAEAETQLGRPLAKLELVAKGVELL